MIRSKVRIMLLQCRARLHLDKSGLSKCIQSLLFIHEQDPLSAAIKETLVDAYIANSQFTEALTLCDGVDTASRFQVARIFLFQERFSECETLLLTLTSTSENAKAELLLGECYWNWTDKHRSNRAFAYDRLLKCLRFDKNNAQAYLLLGHFYTQIDKDTSRALKCYQKAFSLDQSCTSAAQHIVSIQLDSQDFQEAENILKIYTTQYPRSGWAWFKLGLVYSGKSDYGQALIQFQNALRIDSRNLVCWENLAYCYEIEGKFIASIKAFERCTEIDPTSLFALYSLGRIKHKLGIFVESVASFEKALVIQPGNVPIIHALISVSLAHAGSLFGISAFGRSTLTACKALNYALLYIESHCDQPIDHTYKLLGDVCMFLATIDSTLDMIDFKTLESIASHLKTSEKHLIIKTLFLNAEPSAIKVVTLLSLYQLASGAYKFAVSLALKLGSGDIIGSYWSDLSRSVHLQSAQPGSDPKLAQLSIQCITLAIYADPTYPTYWNTLGIYTINLDTRLSQHAFIKTLELNPDDATAWSNLALLYMKSRDMKLARKAFASAKHVDPEHPNAWFGESLVNKATGTAGIDLIEQSYELDSDNMHEINYQYAVKMYQEARAQPHPDFAVPIVCLLKYVAIRPYDSAALNLLGIMYESQRNLSAALEYYKKALLVTRDSEREKLSKIKQNITRCLCSDEQYTESLAIYSTLTEQPTIWSVLINGLSHFFLEDYQSAFTSFETALQSALTHESIANQNEICHSLSLSLYALGHDDHITLAKQQLLSTITRDPSYVKGILSLCAMGLLRNDQQLAQSAFVEIQKFTPEQMESMGEKVYYLKSAVMVLGGDFVGAKRVMCRAVHASPYTAARWIQLFSVIQKYEQCTGPTMQSIAKSAQVLNAASQDINLITDVYIALTFGSAYNSLSRRTDAFRDAQRCVRFNPSSSKSLTVLYLSLNAKIIEQKSTGDDTCELVKSLLSVVRALKTFATDGWVKWARLFELDYSFNYTNVCDAASVDALLSGSFDPKFSLCCYALLIQMNDPATNMEETLQAYTQLIDITPNTQEMRNTLALYYYRLKRYDESIKLFLGDSELQNLPSSTLLHLAKTYYETEDFSKCSKAVAIVNAREPCLASRVVQGLLIIEGGKASRAGKMVEELEFDFPHNKYVAWLRTQVDKLA